MKTKGFFGIGVEGINKAMNVGAIYRTAHAFGASFLFTVADTYDASVVRHSDTSGSSGSVPFYRFPDIDHMMLPDKCALVGVELTEDAIELPSFHHPKQAAYVLGPERKSLTPEMMARCKYTLKIPMKFCVNVGVAAAIVCYDRMISVNRFAPRPVGEGGPREDLRRHVRGGPVIRTEADAYLDTPPALEDSWTPE